MERKLAVLLSADISGYARLIAADEEGTLAVLAVYRETIAGLVAEHDGRIFGTAGDGLVAEFASAVQAVRAAVAIQRALRRRNADLPADRRLEFRIGLNLGDVVVAEDDLLGDGVNVAARLQEIADPGGICISGALRDQIADRLDFPLTGLGERSLKNLPRPVRAFRVGWHREEAPGPGRPAAALALPDKPSIAVLPFTNMSGDPEQEFFADGLTEDIITALSHYRWFFVIARNSSFAYKGRALDVKQIARELGVRYVLEGSVRRAGQRVRVTGQLIEADSGVHLWAQRYDRDYADIFAVQDELTLQVVGAMEPEIQMGEGRRALQKPTDNLTAYECCMRGIWHHYQITVEHLDEAVRWERQAIALDPRFGRAHMALSRILCGRCVFGLSRDIEADRAEVAVAAAHALSLDDRDPYNHYAMFQAHLIHGRLSEALAEAQRAIDLKPNFVFGHLALGWVRVFTGHFAAALDPLHVAIRLSPHDGMGFHFTNRLALAHFGLGNYEESVRLARDAVAARRLHLTLAVLAAGLGRLGRTEEAAALLPELCAATPPDTARYWDAAFPYRDPAHRADLIAGLAAAGYDASAEAAYAGSRTGAP